MSLIGQKKTITAKELSEQIGLHVGTLVTHLSIFPKYIKGDKYYYIYEYSYNFLNTIKEFYKKKMYSHKGMYAKKYSYVIKRLEEMMKEIEG